MSDDLQALSRVQRTVERFVRGRPDVSADADREDVVQEALARLLENRSRLEPEAWEAYAVVSARNLLLDRELAGHVRRRHEHRLHAPDVTAGAEEQVLTQEEHSALRRAMTSLPPEDRSLLGVHVLGTSAADLVHVGQALLGRPGGVDFLVSAVFNYPTFAESYKVAALDALNRMRVLGLLEAEDEAEAVAG